MKKKLLSLILTAVVAIPAVNAQMQRGLFTISTTFWGTGSGMFINIVPETEKQTALTQVNVGGSCAYYVARNLALKGEMYVNAEKYGKSDPVTTTNAALGVKYHFVRGFYGELSYLSMKSGKKDAVMYGRLELGYDIFVNDYFYIEPAGYFRTGLNDSTSKFGASLGFGVAF